MRYCRHCLVASLIAGCAGSTANRAPTQPRAPERSLAPPAAPPSAPADSPGPPTAPTGEIAILIEAGRWAEAQAALDVAGYVEPEAELLGYRMLVARRLGDASGLADAARRFVAVLQGAEAIQALGELCDRVHQDGIFGSLVVAIATEDLTVAASPDAGIAVTEVNGEYAFIAAVRCGPGRAGRYRAREQALVPHGGGMFDRLGTTCTEDGSSRDFYFDIAAVWAGYTEMLDAVHGPGGW